ncbi:MAG: methylated-DNA--[protein]-cysteine S-methyltransferase [Actinomycetia bacterium]|nr:methylated-DNA--[protein]-cysteine S-methyltransferase [Actinomycetes bacterium]
MRYAHIDSPLGALLLVGDESGLAGLHLTTGRGAITPSPAWEPAATADFADARAQLDEYFAGARQRFELALRPAGTPYQLRVWAALRDIPYGATTSYGELAAAIGSPAGARAVGLANGRNPISIIVPCHRVVGADGSLTGYGGGLPAKRWLLDHEARHAGRALL